MNLAVLPWQEAQWQRVIHALAEGRLAHALLLAGPEGVGKRQFGEALAARLLCEVTGTGEACGSCPACRQFAAGNHPDMIHLEPAETGKALGVDAVRDLIDRLHLTAGHGVKVGLIDPADAMTASAGNSVLKTLEEPPSGTYLILASARPGQLPATVRSRCQRIGFAIPSPEEAIAWLRRMDIADPDRWLAPASGAPLLAHTLAIAGSENRAGADPVDALLAVLMRRRSPVGAAAALGGDSLEGTVRAWIAAVEDILRLQHAPDARLRFPGRRSTLLDAAQRVDARNLFHYLDELYRSLPGPSSSLKPGMQIQGLLVGAAKAVEGN